VRATVLRKSYPAQSGAVGRIRREVAEIAAALARTEEVVDHVQLAVSEAATNVVRHAYADGRGEIHVTVSLPEERVLAVIVADDGDWLTQPRHSLGLGLGLLLMRECADGFHVERTGSGGVGVHMSFLLDGSRTAIPSRAARAALLTWFSAVRRQGASLSDGP
jgi:anti-sigma regulatory factor (Ser/Thr protein kinase)